MSEESKNDPWLEKVQQIHSASTSYMDTNYRSKWEDCLRHFQSQHHAGSKYNKDSYKYRSRLFRPKTRSMVRNKEAQAAAALFGNMDLVSIEPQDINNPFQAASADINRELLSYRLQNSIPWFVICMGALQDAIKLGVICSYQTWEYKERVIKYDDGTQDFEILKDRPIVKLLPIENVRISPNSDWTDPINSSPYLEILWPMYVKDVKLRMKEENRKTGQKKWHQLNDNEILAASKSKFDSTRSTRDQNREDPAQDAPKGLTDFDIVWVHEVFINLNGQDVHFYTLGTEYRLTDPAPIEETYFTGERPVAMGTAAIETHRLFPDSDVGVVKNLQKELNENVNQRMDNVKLVLNKRYKVKRGSAVDLRSIVRNVAGSVTMVDSMDDVDAIEFHDVTASSYQEQDRLNADFDSLGGGFDSGSVNTNRKLNETVGGMAMLRSGANSLNEYTIKIFAETWLEPVIKQLIKLEQKYESDLVVLSIAGQKAQVWQKYGINQITDELLNQMLTITVSAGMGTMDPMLRLERFVFGVDKYTDVAVKQSQLPMPILNVEEVGKEIFGRLGYKDGSRFVFQQTNQQNQLMMTQMQQMQEAIQQLQAALNDKQADRNLKLIETQMKEEGQNRRKGAEIEADLQIEAMKAETALKNPVAGEKAA